MATAALADVDDLDERFGATRALTVALAAPLSDADATVQSMADASPAKWHLAHTTWFLETFVLAPLGATPFDPRFGYLFNSYYEAAGPRHPRGSRGLLTRPALGEVLAWREHVDTALDRAWGRLDAELRALVELGIAHEQQHQELLLTDILHLFAQNPIAPAMYDAVPPAAAEPVTGAIAYPGGVVTIGARSGFAFDCEGPAHDVLVAPFRLARAAVTNAEWDAFVADGGYDDPRLWLSDGWAWRQREAIAAPLHWRPEGREFTLSGEVERRGDAPVAHVSQYEADAFAAWAGARLPTEVEWEAAAAGADPAGGNQLDRPGWIGPRGGASLFGDVWTWTASAFLPYPRFRAADGAVGEYNGKFMSGQIVLRGASCATPRGHSRTTYRNFFPPAARWQFSGVRLAYDV